MLDAIDLNALILAKGRNVPVGYAWGRIFVVRHPNGGQNNLVSKEAALALFPNLLVYEPVAQPQ